MASNYTDFRGFAERLKKAREDHRLNHGLTQFSQSDLGDLAGITTRSISMWEQGDGLPTGENLWKLAVALNVKVDWLLFGEGEIQLIATKIVGGESLPNWLERTIEALKQYPADAGGVIFQAFMHAQADLDKMYPAAARRIFSTDLAEREKPAGAKAG